MITFHEELDEYERSALAALLFLCEQLAKEDPNDGTSSVDTRELGKIP
jgi:hypothetical protein